jgi:heme exporter protein D
MIWTSPEAFFHMGGYGLYVWGSYAVTVALMLTEGLTVRRRLQAAKQAAAKTTEGGQGA